MGGAVSEAATPFPAAVCACSSAAFLPGWSSCPASWACPGARRPVFLRSQAASEDRLGVEMRPEGSRWAVMVLCTQRSR